jgi:hypothetical protein
MAQQLSNNDGYFGNSNNVTHGREKDDIPSELEGKGSSAPAYPDAYDDQTGEFYDPYGGKKLGMVRVCANTSSACR